MTTVAGNESFAASAMEYHKRDLNVIPTVSGMKKPPKGFDLDRWFAEQQTVRDVSGMVDMYPGHGLAVVLGGPGRRLVDLDVDDEAGHASILRSGLPMPHSTTWMATRGLHRLYETDERLPRRPGIMDGVDFLGNGIALVPPTDGRDMLHGLDEIAPLPTEWRELVRDARGRRHHPYPKVDPTSQPTPLPTEEHSSVGEVRGDVVRETYLARQEWIEEGLRNARVLALAAESVGAVAGAKVRCPWPDQHRHGDADRSAGFFTRTDGTPAFHCFRCGSFNLPELYASAKAGRPVNLRGAKWAVWALRLLFDAEVIKIKVPPIPSNAPDGVIQVAAGWNLLRALKRSHPGFTEPDSAFAWGFVQAWCGVTDTQASNAKKWMRENGLLIPSGRKAGKATLYRLEIGH